MLFGEEGEEEEVAESRFGHGYMTEGEKASTAKVESACDDVKNFSPYWVFSPLLLVRIKWRKARASDFTTFFVGGRKEGRSSHHHAKGAFP